MISPHDCWYVTIAFCIFIYAMQLVWLKTTDEKCNDEKHFDPILLTLSRCVALFDIVCSTTLSRHAHMIQTLEQDEVSDWRSVQCPAYSILNAGKKEKPRPVLHIFAQWILYSIDMVFSHVFWCSSCSRTIVLFRSILTGRLPRCLSTSICLQNTDAFAITKTPERNVVPKRAAKKKRLSHQNTCHLNSQRIWIRHGRNWSRKISIFKRKRKKQHQLLKYLGTAIASWLLWCVSILKAY